MLYAKAIKVLLTPCCQEPARFRENPIERDRIHVRREVIIRLRFFRFVTGLAFAFAIVASLAGAHATPAYSLTYGPKNLGTWNTLKLAKSASGSYDGAAFNSGTGSGYPTVQLTRALSAVDRQSLFSTLPPANGPLVVHVIQGDTVVSITTCPKSQVADFGSDGDPGTGKETITFACTSIVTTKP